MSYVTLSPSTPVNTAFDQMNATAAKADTAVQPSGTTFTGAIHNPTPVSLTSATGVLTLTEASNSFIANGSESITSITGWTSGLVRIRWNTARTLVYNATSLILQNSTNRAVSIGDTSLFEVTASGVREVDFFPAVTPVIAQVGIANNIINGMTVTAGTGLQAVVATGRCVISESVVNFDTFTNTISLSPRMAALIYAKSDKTIGKVEASLPVIDNFTVARYILDGSNTLTNLAVGLSTSAVANNLTKNGTVNQVDGWMGYAAQGDGTTGGYTSANNTGFPSGASEREIDILYIPKTLTGNRCILNLGNTSTQQFNILQVGANLNFYQSASVDTSFVLESLKPYLISVLYDGTILYVKINGSQVFQTTISLNTASSVLTILKDNATFNDGTIQWIDVRNKMRTTQQISQMSNALLFPCYYTASDGVTRNNMQEILPANTTSISFIRTSSTLPILIDNTSYGYGIRLGASGGNRKVFLGWKAFSGSPTLFWTSPFGTRKIETEFTWAQDANGTNESDITPIYYDSPSSAFRGLVRSETPAQRIQVYPSAGGVTIFNGAWQTSGYLGCYAEVLE